MRQAYLPYIFLNLLLAAGFGEIPSVDLDLAIDIAGLLLGIYLAVNRLH